MHLARTFRPRHLPTLVASLVLGLVAAPAPQDAAPGPDGRAADEQGDDDQGADDQGAGERAATPAPPQDPRGAAGGLTREQMWYAPTAEDWAKPVLIEWQRTWDDAVALSRETQRPILVCVNMDGEIASEHYAGIRYRQPEIAALYEPYVCVIASTYRHNPRDYDEAGNRIECPRFGTVTCGEHIWIEPVLYEKFLDGVRVAPRHIMVELDGSETYDVYYAFDTDSVFAAIRDGIEERTDAPPFVERGDRSLVDRVGSPDSSDREQVEAAFADGSRALKETLLDAVANRGADASLDLLRLGIHDLDPEVARRARERLAAAESVDSVGLINVSLRADLDEAERRLLVAALERLGEQSPQARLLAAVHRGLGDTRATIDVEQWRRAVERSRATSSDERARDAAAAAADEDADAADLLDLAEASVELAYDPRHEPRFARVLLDDARGALERAVTAGASGWRVNALRALVADRSGDREAARTHAEAAVAALPAGAEPWSAIAVLSLRADHLRRAIDRAVRRNDPWPEQWLADYHAAMAVLAAHPSATAARAVEHYDFLWRLGAWAASGRVLDAALVRFPGDWELHVRLRGRTLYERGAAGLEPAYARLVAADPSPVLVWYQAYASFVAAESARRTREVEAALERYGRAEATFARAAELDPNQADTCDHWIALALAGRARIALEAEDLETATRLLVGSLERCPTAAGSLDGLNLSPSDTSRTLRAALVAAERPDLVEDLEAALATIDPRLLELPAYERTAVPAGDGRGGR